LEQYAARLAYDIQTFGTLNRLLGRYLKFAFGLPILLSDVCAKLSAAFSLKKSEIRRLVSFAYSEYTFTLSFNFAYDLYSRSEKIKNQPPTPTVPVIVEQKVATEEKFFIGKTVPNKQNVRRIRSTLPLKKIEI
jgi:hypothetical protein